MKRLVAMIVAVLALGVPSIVQSAFPGSNGKIAFATFRDSNYEIFSMNPDGTGQTNLTNDPAIDANPAWSPDGSQIAFVSNRQSFGYTDLYVMSTDGSSVRKLAEAANQPAWAPDGTRIAYVCGQLNICVVNADGTGLTLVHGDTYKLDGPVWSPDGTRIAFARPMMGSAAIRSEIFLMSPDGTGVAQLTTQGGAEPDWSPDGSKIAFSSDRDSLTENTGNIDVYVMEIAAGEGGVTRLTFSTGTTPNNVPVGSFSPAWSPDGLEIAFGTNRDDGNQEVYTMRADGSLQTNVSGSPWVDARPDWQPASGGAALTVEDVSVTEGDSGTTNADFTVRLSAPSSTAISVDYATADGTASAGSDYTGASGSLTFAPGETYKFISVSVTGDGDPEGGETFVVNLTNPAGATIADGQGVATIVDDDVTPYLGVYDTAVQEGDSGSTPAPFEVVLALPEGKTLTYTVTVDYATADETATAGSDYTATSGRLTFAPGEMSKTISVSVTGDTDDEPHETFVVNLTNPAGAVIADAQGVARIVDDDEPAILPQLSVSDVAVTEGDSGSTPAKFAVTLSVAAAQTVTVRVQTVGGTAGDCVDYVCFDFVLAFAPGETVKPVTVSVLGDTELEPDETFTVVLSGATNATIADGTGQGTIMNDDAAAVSAADLTVVEGNINSTHLIELSIPHGEFLPVEVGFAATGGTATNGVDYVLASGTVTFTPGSTSLYIPLFVVGDLEWEFDETIVIALSNVRNADVRDGVVAVTIANDDAYVFRMPDLVVSAVSAPETASPGELVTISYTVTNQGAATAGSGLWACKWRDRLSMTETNWSLGGHCQSEPLAPGSSYTRTFTVTLPGSEWPFVLLMVKTDAMNDIYESDEGNNTRWAAIRIAKPDLVVSAVSAPETAAPGELVTITFTITNQGRWEAGDEAGGCQWRDTVRLTPGSWFTSSCGTAPLAPRSSYTGTATVTIPSTVPGDEVKLSITTDARHAVSESSESNNGREVTIMIVR